MRNKKGQFVNGHRPSVATEFKKGQHWRKHQPFRDKEWLEEHYSNQQLSTGDIAEMFGVTDGAIIFWLRKHEIPRRTIAEARSIKKWGQSGTDNPMWNRRGELNHNWRGGITPQRQAFYISQEWKTACSTVWKRDNATCQRCGLPKKDAPDMPFHIHHIISFADEDLRGEPDNLILMCESCHQFIHSKRNVDNEFIQEK